MKIKVKNKGVFLGLLVLLTFSNTFAQVTTTVSTSSSTATTTLTTDKNKIVIDALFKFFADQKNPVPKEFKAVEKELKASTLASDKYNKELFSVAKYASGLEYLNIKNKQGATKMVKELDQKIKNLSKLKADNLNKDTLLEKAMNKKIKDSDLLAAYHNLKLVDEDRLKSASDNYYSNAVELLYNAKSFYTLLSKTNSRFETLKGKILFEDPNLTVDYLEYLNKARRVNNAMTSNMAIILEVISKNPDFFGNLFSQAELEDMKKMSEAMNQYTDVLASGTSTLLSVSTKEQSVSLELERRISENTRVQQISEEIAQIDIYLGNNLASSSASVVLNNKLELKKMVDNLVKMNKLLKEYQKIVFDLTIAYERENPKEYMIYSAIMSYTDDELKQLTYIVQKNAADSESYRILETLYTLLYANFGKFKTHFEDPNERYNYSFQNAQAHFKFTNAYDKYMERFKVYVSNSDQN